MLLRIYHETTYRYAHPVCDSYTEARLRPASDAEQGCVEYSLSVTPTARLYQCRTAFGWVDFFNVLPPHETLRLVSQATVITMPRDPFERVDLLGEDWALLAETDFRDRFCEYLQPPREPEVTAEICRQAAEIQRGTDGGVAAFLVETARHIHAAYAYDPRATTVTTPLAEVLENRRGVCQDFSHLMIALARAAGVPARYVSGYLHVPPPGPGEGAMHAWVEAYVPRSGWVGLDPTHGLLVDHHYVKVGVGRSYRDVPPTHGLFRGPQEHTLEVRVRVTEASVNGDGQREGERLSAAPGRRAAYRAIVGAP